MVIFTEGVQPGWYQDAVCHLDSNGRRKAFNKLPFLQFNKESSIGLSADIVHSTTSLGIEQLHEDEQVEFCRWSASSWNKLQKTNMFHFQLNLRSSRHHGGRITWFVICRDASLFVSKCQDDVVAVAAAVGVGVEAVVAAGVACVGTILVVVWAGWLSCRILASW